MRFTDIAMWLILAAVAVLVVMNGKSVATVLTAGFQGSNTILATLTGSDYRTPR